MTDSHEFDWNPKNDDGNCIVVLHQPAIAVYTNPRDAVVIRQKGHYGPEEDHFVFVTKENVLTVARRMLELAGIHLGEAFDELASYEALEAPKDRTGAERQKRFRNRHRNRVERDETVMRNAQPLLIAAE